MFSDRYMPDADDDYEPASSPRRTSHREGAHEGKEQHKSSKHHHGSHKHKRDDKPRRREASVEDVEDGEIVDAAAERGGASPAGDTAPAAAAAGKGSDGVGVTTADVASNGKHRYPVEDAGKGKLLDKGRASSPVGSPNAKQPGSSKPPSSKTERNRERSRDRSRHDRDRDRDKHRSSRDRSRDRAPKERSSSGQERGKERSPERDVSGRDRRPERSRECSSRDHSKDRSRERSRDRRKYGADLPPSRRPSSSRDPDLVLPPPPRERSSSRQRVEDSRRGMDDSRRGSRYGSEAGGRHGPSEQRRPEPMAYEARQRLRDRERDGDDRKRRSRSRSRSRQDWRGREDERSHKRSRDEGRERRHSSPELELDVDPNALLETDALGLSKAEREAEEEAKRLEESRRRRHAILAKHQQAAAVAAPTSAAAAAAAAAGAGGDVGDQQQQQASLSQPAAVRDLSAVEGADGDASPAAAAAAAGDGAATPEGERSSSEDSHNAPGTPVMDIWNTGQPLQQVAGADEASSRPTGPEELTSQLPVHMVVPGTEPNMQSERLRVAMPNAAAEGRVIASTAAAAAAAAGADDVGGGGDDMFADDDDMFGEGGGGGGAAGVKRTLVVPAGLMDNYDDPEGYYNFQVGEVLDNRYEVFACKGKGVFSTVLRARDKLKLVPNPITGVEEFAEVAIKVIRSNETMSKAAALEQRILRMLSDKDPDNRKHVIRMLRTFEYRHHVCMVFEPMDMNLRELTLKYGRNVGLNITAVGVYAAQLLVALRHLQQCGVLHADIKPDNILVNARRSKVKICDLGSAMLAGENERTPYLVSRFYRSPEVILGLAYDFPMDMWSVGCVLYELFTGKILFPGRTNNDMLKLMMDVKGPFPKKMLKKGIFVEKHFEPDAQLSFSLVEEDPVTKQPVRRVITNPTVKHNLSQLLAKAEGDKQQVAQLADLLDRMLALDPDKRISADSALRHDFVKPFLPKKKPGSKH